MRARCYPTSAGLAAAVASFGYVLVVPKRSLTSVVLTVTALAWWLACEPRVDRRDGDASGPLSASSASAASGETSWPAFPRNEVEAKSVIDTARLASSSSSGGTAEPDAGEPGEMLEGVALQGPALAAINAGRVFVGAKQIGLELARRAKDAQVSRKTGFYLLWGTIHDAGPQVDAFRRLINAVDGATGGFKWDDVFLEQLRADGHWRDIELPKALDASTDDVQRGDTRALDSWRTTGANSALIEVRKAQWRDDYAAWKFDYVDSVVDVVRDARLPTGRDREEAAAFTLRGCDMPLRLQALLGEAVRTKYGEALREVHCAHALRDALRQSPSSSMPRVAMLWGEHHILPSGFSRLLPKDAVVLRAHVIGGRPPAARDGVYRALAATFDLAEPMLVELTPHGDLAYVLADAAAGEHVDRKRIVEKQGANLTKTRVMISSTLPRTAGVRIDGAPISPGDRDGGAMTNQDVALGEGSHTLVVPRGAATTLVSFEVPERGGWVEIHLERTAPEVTITVHEVE